MYFRLKVIKNRAGSRLLRQTPKVFKKVGHSRPLLFIFVFSIQLIINKLTNKCSIKFCRWLESNRGPLVSKATTLPTEPQPQTPKVMQHFQCNIPSMVDHWASPGVHLLLLKSSISQLCYQLRMFSLREKVIKYRCILIKVQAIPTVLAILPFYTSQHFGPILIYIFCY